MYVMAYTGLCNRWNKCVMRTEHRLIGVVFWATVLACAALPEPARAKTVTLRAVLDCTVKSSQPDATFSREDLAPYKNGTLGAPGEINLSYVQFALPRDIASVAAATLKLVQTTNNGSFAYYVYGLHDDVAQPPADTYTWNNAPGHDPADLVVDNGHRYDPATSSYIAYVPVSRLDPVGREYDNALDSDGLTWLAADTDGVATLMLVRRQVSSIVSTLAYRENPDYPGPRLEIVYTSNGNGIGVTVAETGGTTEVSEQGPTSDTYTIRLNEIPAADVTITVTPGFNTVVSPTQVTFTQQNWDQLVTITVTAVDDDVSQGVAPYTSTITHSVTSADPYYNGIAVADVVVVVTDNDYSCGDLGYLPEDLNHDCYIDLHDLAAFASAWMRCTDPSTPQECGL